MEEYKCPKSVVDVIIEKYNCIVLIERGNEPYKGKLAIPGGFVEYGETVENAAVREAKEETSLDVRLKYILGVYSDPKRDPRGHALSVVFIADPVGGKLQAKSDAAKTEWYHIGKVEIGNLAFDHAKMIADYKSWQKNRRGTFWSSRQIR